LSFVAKLQRAREVLEQQGRLSVRALARELDLAGDEFDELIAELVDVQRVALREGSVLVWANRQAPADPAARRSATDPRIYTPKHLADQQSPEKTSGGEPALQRRPLRIVLQREVVDDALGGAEDDLQRHVEIAVASGSIGANVRRHGRRAVL
jgi:hypothetical protein